MSDTIHAVLSPSSSERWLQCPGSASMEMGYPNKDSDASREGTGAHEVLERRLKGHIVPTTTSNGTQVTTEMSQFISVTLKHIQEIRTAHIEAGAATDIFSEVSVPIDHLTGEAGARGTSDVVLVAAYPDRTVMVVIDLKYGRGVEVFAESNSQLVMYASGAAREFELIAGPIDEYQLVISQPRVSDNPKIWTINSTQMATFEKNIAEIAKSAMACVRGLVTADLHLNPSPKACKFCRASADCQALSKFVEVSIGSQFKNLDANNPPGVPEANDELSIKMRAIPIIEVFCTAVRAKVEAKLLSGESVHGFKLVKGRDGARSWVDEVQAELTLKSFRLKTEDMYNLKVISPTQAEKVLKESPKRWSRLQELITRAEGKPSVAPESDKRPAIVLAQFDNEEENQS